MKNQEETKMEQAKVSRIQKKSLFAYVSLVLALIATSNFFSGEYFNILLWLACSFVGFVTGLYSLFKEKKGMSIARICAILGTAISGVWICLVFIK